MTAAFGEHAGLIRHAVGSWHFGSPSAATWQSIFLRVWQMKRLKSDETKDFRPRRARYFHKSNFSFPFFVHNQTASWDVFSFAPCA
jgi:hypothetical protein